MKSIFFIIIINLFNLLPVSPLDGGRVIKSVLMSMSLRKRLIGFYCWGFLALVSVLLVAILFKFYFMAVLIAFFAYQELEAEWIIYKEFEKKLIFHILNLFQ